MTAAWLSIAVLFGTLIGLKFGGLDQQKPLWWRIATISILVSTVVLALSIPIAGTFGAADMSQVAGGSETRVAVAVSSNGDGTYSDEHGKRRQLDLSGLTDEQRAEVSSAEEAVISVVPMDGGYRVLSVDWIDPPVTFPLIPALQERARNVFFHVPTAWVATLAWFVAAFYAVRFLRKRNIRDDIRSSSAAAVGFLFCATATVSGSVWSRFDWGSYWNWDPRQISIVVVLLIFGAYFALRSAVDSGEARARISAVYVTLMALPVLFFIGVFPRLMKTLHPNNLKLNTEMAVLFPIAALALTLLYFWMTNVTVRVRSLESGAVSFRDEESESKPIVKRPVKTAITPGTERLEGGSS